MVPNKSLDKFQLIAALLLDAHMRLGVLFNTKSLRLTTNVAKRRYLSEGTGFLTKTLPRLCKHFDQALTGTIKLNPTSIGFATIRGTELPRFLGELFSQIFQKDGSVLPDPNAQCVMWIRRILLFLYKLELPYTDSQEQEVISAFKQAEKDLSDLDIIFAEMRTNYVDYCSSRVQRSRWRNCRQDNPPSPELMRLETARRARRLLSDLFATFDPTDVIPRHGPGAVATKQRLWEKFRWTNVSSRVTSSYPFDAYFCASPGHVCDSYDSFSRITDEENSARVILVPKDSRGPRLISCEPVDFQWAQQGLSSAIVRHVERHHISRYNVFFTDQGPNQRGALLGSQHGRYVTLDLKEASDRVHLDLVRLLFPESLISYLENCRTLSTVLPSGELVKLRKFAPMGSALCFPVMALTIWALLTSFAPNADTRESILVYGDDVIVPTAYAESAMAILELFGLKINRNKSCTGGLFRESCGVDAFKGVNVTPVRLRTVWSESPCPESYASYISYANAFWDRKCYATYDVICQSLVAVYGCIPEDDYHVSRSSSNPGPTSNGGANPGYPSLRSTPHECRRPKTRFNPKLQKLQKKVRVLKSPSIRHEMDGWSMLLRYFTESSARYPDMSGQRSESAWSDFSDQSPFSVSSYTKRKTSMLVWRWR